MLRIAIIATVIVAAPTIASAAPFSIYDTQPIGSSIGLGGGLYSDQFLGVRFSVATPQNTSVIGGGFGANFEFGNNLYFGAIVALSGLSDFPDSSNLSTPDVLGFTTFSIKPAIRPSRRR